MTATSVRSFLRKSTWLYPIFLKGRSVSECLFVSGQKIVNRNTDLVIEGYPSSANTFSSVLLKLSQPSLLISSHTHTVSNLRRAQKLDCPIVFIIREPEYCIASLVARFGKSNIDLLFRDYEELYSHCLRIDKGLMVYKFDKLIANPEDFIRDVSEKFSFPLDEERLKYAIRDSKAYIRAWTTVNGNPNSMGLPSRSRKKEVLPIVDSVRMHVAYTLAKQCYLDLERLTDAGHDS